MVMPQKYTEEEIVEHIKPLPDKVHGLFKNQIGLKKHRLEVIAYAGKKLCNKHSWIVKCNCGSYIILNSTSLCNVQSCGCLWKENISAANLGNTVGHKNRKPEQTKSKLFEVKPEYNVLDQGDGRVMSKWKFLCTTCNTEFLARPDNILPRKSGGNQTPCKCGNKRGYDESKNGSFYVFSVDNYCKFGITFDSDRRQKQLSKAYGKELELEFLCIIPDGKVAKQIESSIKRKFNYRVDLRGIDGYSEYRHRADMDQIIEDVCRAFAISIQD